MTQYKIKMEECVKWHFLGGLEEDFKDTTNGMYDVLTFMVQNGTEDSATAAAEMLDNLFESEGVFKDDTEVL